MSETPAPAADPPKKPKRKPAKTKKQGPSVSDLILKVVAASKERSGVSLVALKKGLSASGYDVVKNSFRVKLAVRRLLAKGALIQTKGTGAAGSFKISKKAPKKKAVKKAKKPRAKKAKRTRPKKATAAKKSPKKATAAKKSPKKTKAKTKSPKKTTRPGTKKRKSPKKTNRRVRKPKTSKVATEQ